MTELRLSITKCEKTPCTQQQPLRNGAVLQQTTYGDNYWHFKS